MAILLDEADRLEREGAERSAANIAGQLKKMQAHIDYQITRARAARPTSPLATLLQSIRPWLK